MSLTNFLNVTIMEQGFILIVHNQFFGVVELICSFRVPFMQMQCISFQRCITIVELFSDIAKSILGPAFSPYLNEL